MACRWYCRKRWELIRLQNISLQIYTLEASTHSDSRRPCGSRSGMVLGFRCINYFQGQAPLVAPYLR
jgi:hypothetical protein